MDLMEQFQQPPSTASVNTQVTSLPEEQLRAIVKALCTYDAEMGTKISKCLKITFQHVAKQRARAEVIKRSETNRGVKRRRVEDSDSESATVDNTSKRPKSMEDLDIYFRCKEPYFESETKVSPVCTIPVCRFSPKFPSPNYYLPNYL